MGKIAYDLLPKQKTRKHNLKVEIDIYNYATELYEELERIGIIERVKEVPQLGVIEVPKKLSKTRYDYIMLQLYLHQLIKRNLQSYLKYTYNNSFKAHEFPKDYEYIDSTDKLTLGDILQLLTIAYNIGHFYNTFTASRAVTMMASENKAFFDKVVGASESQRYQNSAQAILNNRIYQRLHLLNSILILERCDQTKKSVALALEILYAYIKESTLEDNSKLRYAFMIFRSVRTVSYIAYDLQIAETPLTIDICNEKGMCILLQELLSEYNNNQPSNNLVRSITKLLDGTVYNESSNAICYYTISRRMVSSIKKESHYESRDYYMDWFIDKDSSFNCHYERKKDYVKSNILKLTFLNKERDLAQSLLADLEKINFTRVGYYDRNAVEQTILVSIRKNCDAKAKRYAAFKTMRCVVNFLRKIPDISSTDSRFLLCSKFFLYYLFNEKPVVIKPTIDREKCVICTRGKNSRIKEVQSLLRHTVANEDTKHEVEFLLSRLINDSINDTSITIPASIIVYEKDNVNKTSAEFDGMIIHPMRKSHQVVFLESKNRDQKPTCAKTCLYKKFSKKLFVDDHHEFKYDDIQCVDYDAYLEFSIK